MISDHELAKELVKELELTDSPKKPPFRVIDAPKAAEESKSAKMLKQMQEIVSSLDGDLLEYIKERAVINRKIIDVTTSIIASKAAVEVLALVEDRD